MNISNDEKLITTKKHKLKYITCPRCGLLANRLSAYNWECRGVKCGWKGKRPHIA